MIGFAQVVGVAVGRLPLQPACARVAIFRVDPFGGGGGEECRERASVRSRADLCQPIGELVFCNGDVQNAFVGV